MYETAVDQGDVPSVELEFATVLFATAESSYSLPAHRT